MEGGRRRLKLNTVTLREALPAPHKLQQTNQVRAFRAFLAGCLRFRGRRHAVRRRIHGSRDDYEGRLHGSAPGSLSGYIEMFLNAAALALLNFSEALTTFNTTLRTPSIHYLTGSEPYRSLLEPVHPLQYTLGRL